MANPLQVARLKRSVEEWNQWRSEYPKTPVDLTGANLIKTQLDGVNLNQACLIGAELNFASLRKADMSGASLHSAHLREANFSGANLSGVNLVQAHALGTKFTNASLTGACIKDLHVNKSTQFADVEADFVFLGFPEYVLGRIRRRFFDRRPHSGNFKPGEFAALFQQVLDTLDLIFVDGIDWQSFFASFQELRQQYSDADLNIQAIEKKSGGSFVVKLEVNEQADKAALQQSWEGIYEENQWLKAQLFRTEGKLEGYKEQLSDFQQKVLQGMSDKTVINNNMQGATVGNMANQLSGNASQVYNAAQDKSLAEAAQEIQALLDQLSETYPTETRREKFDLAEVAAEQAKANLTLWQRIISAIDAGTIGAVGEMLSHPVATFFIDAAQDLAETKPQA